MSKASINKLETNASFYGTIIYCLTFLIFIAMYFLGMRTGDFALLILTGVFSLIWSLTIGLLSTPWKKANPFAIISKSMLFGWGGLVFAVVLFMIYSWIVDGYQYDLSGLLKVFWFVFIAQIGPLWLSTLGGFFVGFILFSLIDRFVHSTGR